ncbi:type IV secretory system conjugative DNA transfer family protein [Streptomyces syringium]|uniref:type IV secretory system conjugative DNA transfer family protein n=1 Tax=Streptomyces syringium TaxID=76729 RepID=UPI0037D6EE6E
MAKSSGSGMDDSTLLAALAFGFVTCTSAVLLLAAPLAGVLSGHGWVSSTKSLPETVLLSALRGPGAVYDPSPPAWLFWLLVVLLAAALLVAAGMLIRRFGLPGSNLGGAQWGGASTERKMAVHADPTRRRDRITAGRGKSTKKIVAAERNISATAFGIPGSSKTSGLVLPNASEWVGPLVVTTTKAADLDAIYAARSRIGPVWVIAPAGIPGRTTHRWSPVDYCTDAKAADRMASWLADASSSGHDKRAAPWVDQARGILKGLLLAANVSKGGISAFNRWLGLGKDAVEHVRGVLEGAGFQDVADDYARPWVTLHEDGIGSIAFTLNVISSVYRDEEVRDSASGTDFTVEELIDQRGTVCLIASPSDADRFAPLLTALIASVIHGAEMHYNQYGPLNPALGVMVDEAGNMLRYPKLPNVLTTGRGMGITLLTIWHDLSQLRLRLGPQAANTVISASGLRMLLPGCADPETLQLFGTLFGRTKVQHSPTSSVVETDLAPVHELMQLPEFTAIAQYSNLPPVKVDMRRTYVDADLKKWLAPPAPTSGPSLTKTT